MSGPLRLVTWNINSLRLRLPLVRKLVDALRPDAILLQEIKVPDEHFPREAIAELGFPHVAFQGMKSYNGVAILSRFPLSDIRTYDWCERSDCRHLSARLPSGLELHNLYVPAGGDIPDPAKNDKFAHKLRFLRDHADWWRNRRNGAERLVLAGDLNVAPLPTDVWSHEKMVKVVSHTPREVELLDGLQAAGNWVDAVRRFVPAEQRLYTWWSYRARDWVAADRGRRLDHLWVSPALSQSLVASHVVREARGWALPSDHVPVVVDLADPSAEMAA